MSVKDINQSEFDKLISISNIPVVVDFYADWCAPCKRLSPILDELSEKYTGQVVVVKVNIDNNIGLATSIAVQSIPLIATFKNGMKVSSAVGFSGRESLEKLIASLI